MYKLVIDDLDSPERFPIAQEAKDYAAEFFGTTLDWKNIDGYQTAKFEEDVTIQIKWED